MGDEKKPRLLLDLDGVVFEETGDWTNYANRKMLPGVPTKLEKLSQTYDVFAYTARFTDDFWVTVEALQKHNLHQYIKGIYFDKPQAKYYIDDRLSNDLWMDN